jgi:hypothetical protein
MIQPPPHSGIQPPPHGMIQPPPRSIIQPPPHGVLSHNHRERFYHHRSKAEFDRAKCMCERALARTVNNRSKYKQVTTPLVSSLRPVPTRRQPLANKPPVSCTWPNTLVLNDWRNQLGSSFRTVLSGPGLQSRPTTDPWRAVTFSSMPRVWTGGVRRAGDL